MLEVDIPAERLRPLRRSEYDQLVEIQAFCDEKVELLYGRLVVMSPQGTRHAGVIQRLTMILAREVGERAEVRVQLPLAVSDTSEPEPDLSIVERGDYLDQHPSRALLVVEVAESSVAEDRAKAGLYAACGVPDYWIVNLKRGVVEVYREPDEGRYSNVSRHERGGALSLVAFPDVSISLDQILPPQK